MGPNCCSEFLDGFQILCIVPFMRFRSYPMAATLLPCKVFSVLTTWKLPIAWASKSSGQLNKHPSVPHPESPSYRARGNWQLLGRNAALHENGLHRLSFWLPGPAGTDVREGLAGVILHRWLVTGGQLWDFKSPYHSRWLSWSCVGCKPSATAQRHACLLLPCSLPWWSTHPLKTQ